ncbi:hypothetical protein VNI00_016781 [Paramarasmius palmivorus]|uniref:F-box domain-containing protein n=1 Tax=Paramarasmius palmivorus TaxID=297713 RepID=A0AAW0BBY2_9AGAR
MKDNIQDLEPHLERTFKDNIHLRSQHNAQLPISRLPTEILADIFLYCMEHGYRRTSGNVVHLGHVCHHWRMVSVNYPPLWSTPDFSRPLLARMIVQRSKPGPLDVNLDSITFSLNPFAASPKFVVSPESVSVMSEALAESSRIRSLEVTSDWIPFDIAQRILALFQKPMPLLDSLAVHAYKVDQPVELPITFSPTLKKLDLMHCNVPWGIPMLANVTDLTLSGVGFPMPPTDSQLLGTLNLMPLLEHLSLTEIFPLSFSQFTPVVNLPRLRRFVSRAYSFSQSSSCLRTLPYISFPHTPTIWNHIVCNQSMFDSPRPDGSARFFRNLFERLSLTRNLKTKALDVSVSRHRYDIVTVQVWADKVPPKFLKIFDNFEKPPRLSECTEPRVEAEITWKDNLSGLATGILMKQLILSLSLKSLHTVRTHMRDRNGSSVVQLLLDSLVDSIALKCLHVSESDAYALFSLLTAHHHDSHETASQSGDTLPFPALQDLGLYDVDLRPATSPDLFASVLAALEARPQKLQRLLMRSCRNITEPQFLRLNTICLKFYTNGVMLYEGDE